MAGVDPQSLTMTEDQLRTMISGLTSTITAAVVESLGKQAADKTPVDDPTNRDKNHGQRLNEKSHKRMDKFAGGEAAWDE